MKLNYKRTFFVGLAFMSICAFWQMYDTIIPLILKNTFEIKETVTGVIMALDNVLALFMLPILGSLSDRVNTRLGKRTPFIITGTAVAVVFMLLLPYSDNNKKLWMFIIALAVVLLAMCSYRSPAVALMPDLTPKPLRSKANAVINLMGALGGVYTLGMIMVLVPKKLEDGENPNYTMLFLSVGGLMIIAVIILVITIKERKLSQEMMEFGKADIIDNDINSQRTDSSSADMPRPVFKSLVLILVSVFLWFTAYNAITTAFSRYAEEVWGLKEGGFANCLMIATAAAVVSYIPIGIIASKLGRKKTILAGIMLMTISYLCGSFFSEYSWYICIVFATTGIGWASINVNSYPMVVEMSKGANIGKYTGYYYTFSMAAQIFTPILSGYLLEHISYRILFPYAVVFSMASFITMIFVKHGDSRPVKKASVIENFDVDD